MNFNFELPGKEGKALILLKLPGIYKHKAKSDYF